MKNYYLPDSYPNTEKGARLYIKEIKASDKDKEEIRLTIKAIKLIIDYNKSGDTQAILNVLEDDKDGTMLFSIDLWCRFTADAGRDAVKRKEERKARISEKKKPITLDTDKKEKYHVKYYQPECYPDNADGMRKYCTDMIKNAATDESIKKELLLLHEVVNLIDDYHHYKEKQPLIDAIENKPELFQSEMFRKFVADINSPKYHPKKEGFRNKSIQWKHQKAIAHVEYFKNMGFPVYYISGKTGKFNACELTADRMSLAVTTVEEIYRNKDKQGGWTATVDGRLCSWHGKAVWVLNGFRPPETIGIITQLEKLIMSLPEKDLKKLESFSTGYDVKKCKLPTTQKELKKIKISLKDREHYDFIKSLQIKEISLKT